MPRTTPRSPVPGVTYISRNGRWQVRHHSRGKCHYLGTFATQSEAEAVALKARTTDELPPTPSSGRRSSTGVPGVHRHHSGKFHVRLWYDGSQHGFGYYDTVEEAALVADRARAELVNPALRDPVPDVDPLRSTRAKPLPERELEYLRRVARGGRYGTTPAPGRR